MTHKILHIIAVLFTALAAALILPRFCKNNRSYFSHLYSEAVYSEILQDFILSHYEYTRENGQIKSFYGLPRYTGKRHRLQGARLALSVEQCRTIGV